MKNYKLLIQYDGTNYAGWQIQKNADTIQQHITDTLKILLKEDVNLLGSGRTDSGVHALGQIANFRTEKEIEIYRFKHSLNSILPNDISILKMDEIDVDFHARFDAKKRAYLYLITQIKSPFYKNYSYFYPAKINIDKLNEISRYFIGEKNFISFCRKNENIENKNCNIYEVRWRKSGNIILFYIQANRFLHGMVRTIIGTILKAFKSENPQKIIEEIFRAENREEASESVPAKGLFLYKVKY